jgi:hypothetical protein
LAGRLSGHGHGRHGHQFELGYWVMFARFGGPP